MAELKIRSFGAAHNNPAYLNVVMPERTFADASSLGRYSKQVLSHPAFPSYAPHAIVFSETPFPRNYFPSRPEVKQVVADLQLFLKQNHPNSVIAFSVNEKLKQRHGIVKGTAVKQQIHSNTGYLVSASGYAAYPKLEGAFGDLDAMAARNPGTWDEVAHDFGGRVWHRRSSRFRHRGVTFPELTLSSNHKIQWRNCLDAIVPKNAAQITLVSAAGLETKDLEKLSKQAEILLVNDSHFSPKAHVLGTHGPIYLRKENNAKLAALEKKLEREFVRVHVVG